MALANIPALTRRRMIGAFLMSATVLVAPMGATPAQAAEDWPNGPVQFYVPASPGGGTDAVARILADALQKAQGAPFVVVNAPGGGGAVAAEQVRNADPNGRTLLFFHTGLMTSYHTGAYPNDPLQEFTPVAVMSVGGSYALAVPADAPYDSVQDLVDAAKAEPEKISLGVQLRGSTHFMGGLLEKDSGAKFRFVEAGSDSDKLVQLQGKQIDAALVNASGTRQYVDTGALKVLGTIGGNAERDPLMPDVASLAEQGFPSTIFGFDFLILGPKGMDPALVTTIHDAVTAAAAEAAVTEQLNTMGMPVTPLAEADMSKQLQDTDTRISETAVMLGLK